MGCAGPKVPSYETKPQKFSWGAVHVWMATVDTARNATSGEGYLLINMSYDKSIFNKSCAISVINVLMTDPDNGEVIIDKMPLSKDGAPMIRFIKDYKTGQFSLSDAPFKFDRASFPYQLDIKLGLDCLGDKTEHKFSKKIDFRMVQPVIWKQ